MQTDAGITGSTIYGGIGSIVNNGTLLKSVGTTTTNSTIITHLTETAQGLIHLAQGNLVLQPQAHADGSATYQSANFILNDKTMLDLTGVDGNTVLVSGTLTFNGTGEVLFSHGFLQAVAGVATLNYPQVNFQWTGGTLEGEWTNTGVLHLSGDGPKTVYENTLHNQGSIIQTGTGNLELTTDATLDNQAGTTYDLQTDAGITGSTIYGGIGSIVNNGTLLKSVGTTTTNSTIIAHLTATAQGLIHLAQGNLVLQPQAHTDGSATYQSATFTVDKGAVLDPTGGAIVSATGTLTGNGLGELLLTQGTLQAGSGGVTLNFPGSFLQWAGGTLDGGSNGLTNAGTITLAGSGTESFANDLTNNGTVVVTPSNTLAIDGNFSQGANSTLDLQLGGLPSTGKFGQVALTNGHTASLGGTLQADLVNRYTPNLGDSFTVLSYPDNLGTNFAHLNLPSVAGVGFQAQVTSTNVVLNAGVQQPTAPVILTNPAGLTRDAGSVANFTATATGSPTPTVQWQVSADGGKTFNSISGAASTTLTFSTDATQNGYEYRGGLHQQCW